METALKPGDPIASSRIRLFRDLEAAQGAWEELESHSPSYPFQKYAWLSAWQDTIGAAMGFEPAVAVIENADGRPIALLPLASRKGGGLRRLEWMGRGASDYSGALVLPGSGIGSEILLAAVRLAARESGCALIDLDRNPASMGGEPNPILGPAFSELHYASHRMDVPADTDEFLKRRFGTKGRYNLRRAERQLGELGRLEFVVAEDADKRREIADAMIRHKRERCRATGMRDNFNDPGYEDFYRKAACTLGGLSHISALYLDGESVAEHWGAIDSGRLYYLMPAFKAEGLDRYSIGSLLIMRLIDHCRGLGIKSIDFTVGDEEYKARWCSEGMALYRLKEGFGLAGHVVAVAERVVLAAKRGPLLGLGRSLRAALSSIVSRFAASGPSRGARR